MVPGGQRVVALKSRRFKIGICLLVSAVLHICMVSVAVHLKLKRQTPKPVASSSPLKVRIIEAAPTTHPPEVVANQKPRPNVRKFRAPSKKKLAEIIKRYDQIFPKAGDFAIASNNDAELKPDTGVNGLPGFDQENDSIPFAKKTRHLSKLTVFAKDLAEHITVPPALRKIEPSGTARARLNRKGGTWKVTEAAGDLYFRALLYETLDALRPETYGLVMLAATEFESVRVHFEFRTISVGDQTTKPIEVTIDGNKIFIVMTRPDADPKWQMLMASPAGLPMVNLLGVGWVLAKPYLEPDPNADIEVRRLRLSLAFIQPIGR